MYSVFDLAFTYIERFCEEEPTKTEKIEIIHAFEELLMDGWTVEDISNVIRRFIREHPGERPDLYHLFRSYSCRKNNLLQPGLFYYHNQLRIMSGPPKRELNYNTGEIEHYSEPFFLEMRGSYTLDELVDYFADQFDMQKEVAQTRPKFLGAMKYLLKTYHVELILFMIDVAANNTYTEDMNRDFNPLRLSDFKAEAEDALNRKRTEMKLSGDDRIVPRKRVLPFRSGHSVQERESQP